MARQDDFQDKKADEDSKIKSLCRNTWLQGVEVFNGRA